jgi:hypothetical protein
VIDGWEAERRVGAAMSYSHGAITGQNRRQLSADQMNKPPRLVMLRQN